MDTIANFLTSLRNAEMAGRKTAVVPFSKINVSLLGILSESGYVAGFEPSERTVTVNLTDASHTYKRVSKPGRRVYVAADEIPTVLGGRGIAVVSTSSGLMTGKAAKKQGLGGELICEVY